MGLVYMGRYIQIDRMKMNRINASGGIVNTIGFVIIIYEDENRSCVSEIIHVSAGFELLNDSVEEAVQLAKDYVDCEMK